MKGTETVAKPSSPIERTFLIVGSGMTVVGALAMAIMMFLTVSDVMGRYFLNLPIQGTFEMIALNMVFATTWGLPRCQLQGGHIRINMLMKLFPERIQKLVDCLSYLFGFVAFSLLAWQMFVRARRYMSLGDAGITEQLGIPSWPFMMGFVFAAVVSGLVLLYDVIRSFRKVVNR